MNTGNCIKIALEQKGESQQWLATQLGMTRQRVNRIINSKEVWTTTMQKVAAALDMTIDDLLMLDQKKAKP